jgi:hypothetical protein
LGFMPAFSMADSTAKFGSFFCSASVMARLSRLATRCGARALSGAQRERSARQQDTIT